MICKQDKSEMSFPVLNGSIAKACRWHSLAMGRCRLHCSNNASGMSVAVFHPVSPSDLSQVCPCPPSHQHFSMLQG